MSFTKNPLRCVRKIKKRTVCHSENMIPYQKPSPVNNLHSYFKQRKNDARKSDELILRKIELPFTLNEIVNLPLNELYTRSGGKCWMDINSFKEFSCVVVNCVL